MSTTKDDLKKAQATLAEYLSSVFRTRIQIPDSYGEWNENWDILDVRIKSFFSYLPTVRQLAVNGKFVDFFLPLVTQGKGTCLSPPVGQAVNLLIAEDSSDKIEVPTFFYPDGSSMVIIFDLANLHRAVWCLSEHPEYADSLGTGV